MPWLRIASLRIACQTMALLRIACHAMALHCVAGYGMAGRDKAWWGMAWQDATGRNLVLHDRAFLAFLYFALLSAVRLVEGRISVDDLRTSNMVRKRQEILR